MLGTSPERITYAPRRHLLSDQTENAGSGWCSEVRGAPKPLVQVTELEGVSANSCPASHSYARKGLPSF